METNNQFLGRGWSFPPQFDKNTREVNMLDGEADVKSSIEIILSTELGERVLVPSFGWKRDRWLFEQVTTTAATTIEKEVKDSLLFFEPRIDLNAVQIFSRDNESGRVEILIDYTIRTTNTRGNMVYPFYLREI